LKVESETDKLKAIKTLVDENFSLKKENGKLKYRIEHLLLTINSLEEKINTNKI
jgi:regulator of replication initiation timing